MGSEVLSDPADVPLPAGRWRRCHGCMTSGGRVIAFDHAVRVATEWVDDIADAYRTDDLAFAYRLLRAWLHRLSERLSADATVHFAAQLPELLRGIHFEGWNPNRVPERYGVEEYIERFARDAGIAVRDVSTAAATVTAVAGRHLAPGQVDKALAQLPTDLRALLRARTPVEQHESE